jgi:hypothetical protein
MHVRAQPSRVYDVDITARNHRGARPPLSEGGSHFDSNSPRLIDEKSGPAGDLGGDGAVVTQVGELVRQVFADEGQIEGTGRDGLEELPPTVVVPAHGDPVTDNVVERTRRAIDAIDTGMTK